MIKKLSNLNRASCSLELHKRVVDTYGRAFTYLRVSVTDLCNLRCVYCMPKNGVVQLSRTHILQFEEIEEIIRVAASCGVRKIRLTGGEPLVRKGLPNLIKRIAAIKGIEDLGLTTNGTHLAAFAQELFDAGLRRINISMDTLDPKKFKRITRGGDLASVWRGLEVTEAIGFEKIKINVVVMGGFNDDEVRSFARMTLNRNLEVRFIELMPVGEARGCPTTSLNFSHKSTQQTRQQIEAEWGPLRPLPMANKHSATGQLFRLPMARGQIGFISAMSVPFCEHCNRLRLTATGQLCSCLLQGGEVDLRAMLRAHQSTSERARRLVMAFNEAARLKPEIHGVWEKTRLAAMHRLGG